MPLKARFLLMPAGLGALLVGLLLFLLPLQTVQGAPGNTGVITGMVLDDAGQAIPGVYVYVENYDTQDFAGDAFTDFAGHYTVTGLIENQAYRVDASAPGFVSLYYFQTPVFEEATPVLVSGVTADIDFELPRAGAIRGRVIDERTANTGSPMGIPSLEVAAYTVISDTGFWVESGFTDPQGVYTITNLLPGTYYIGTCSYCGPQNWLDEYWPNTYIDLPDALSFAEPISVTGGPPVSGIDFALQPGATVVGMVKDQNTNLALRDAYVSLSRQEGDPLFLGEGVDIRGVYTITRVPPGVYIADAYAPGYESEYFLEQKFVEQADPITITPGVMIDRIDFTLQRLPNGGISGQILDQAGNVITEADVFAETATGEWVGSSWVDSAGVYTIANLGAGRYRVGVNAPGFLTTYYINASDPAQAELVEVLNTVVTGVDIQPRVAASVSGRVLTADTSDPITDAWVYLDGLGNMPWFGGASVDETGTYTVDGVPTGQYKVSAEAPGFDRRFYDDKGDWSTADIISVTAGNQLTGIDIALKRQAGGDVRGRVVLPNGDPVPYAWVDAESANGFLFRSTGADEFGRFELSGIITGEWRIRAFPPPDPPYNQFSQSRDQVFMAPGSGVFNLSEALTLTTVNVVGRVLFPDGRPAFDSWIDVHTPDYEFSRGTGTGQKGYFGLNVPPGDYMVEVFPPWDSEGTVSPPPISLTVPTTNAAVINLGDIYLAAANKQISGRVYLADSPVNILNAPGVPHVEVYANRRGAPGYVFTKTNAAGDYKLDVSPGEWEVMIAPPPDVDVQWIYPGFPKLVRFNNDPALAEAKVVNFRVEGASARVVGQVIGPQGQELQPYEAWVDVRNSEGVGNSTGIRAGGVFTVSVPPGTYDVWLGVDEQRHPTWAVPVIEPVIITDSETVFDLGQIQLLEKTAFIEGQVTGNTSTGGIAGVRLHAWQPEGGWATTLSDSDGNYSMAVLPGLWEVGIERDPTAPFISLQPPQLVEVAEGQTVGNVNFTLTEADSSIAGRVVNQSGKLLIDLDAWAYVRPLTAPHPIAEAPVRNGEFSLKVPNGQYRVGLWLPPSSGYTVQDELEVDVQGRMQMIAQAETAEDVLMANLRLNEVDQLVTRAGTYTVSFTLLENDALIRGTFFKDQAKTEPALGLEGYVFAFGRGATWEASPIDPDTGAYEIPVAAGTWNVGYWLESEGYVNNPPPETRITISSTEEFVLNYSVVAADINLNGVILDPDGEPLNWAWAWAHRDRIPGESASISTGDDSEPPAGQFSIPVPQGGEYVVGAHAPGNLGYIQPDVQFVNTDLLAGTGSLDVPLVFQFKRSNAIISGTVYYNGQAGNEVVGPSAWVWAFSEDGQHVGASVNLDGKYRLNVATGTTWYVGAIYAPEDGSLIYESGWPPVRVPMLNTDQATVDLELERIDLELPDSIADTFDPATGWRGEIGSTIIDIPGGAMPTTNTVRISVTPLVDELPNTLTSRPFGFGYAIAAYDNATGVQITSNFNQNVSIIFAYTDGELQRRGVTEETLSPAYFSTQTNSWEKVESAVIDAENNLLRAEINHFSTWSLSTWSLAANLGDVVIAPIAPLTVTISGPDTGLVDMSYSFAASVVPTNTTTPLTYTWQATDLAMPLVVTDVLTNTWTASWPLTGTKIITVRAENAAGAVTDTFSISIDANRLLETVYLPLVVK